MEGMEMADEDVDGDGGETLQLLAVPGRWEGAILGCAQNLVRTAYHVRYVTGTSAQPTFAHAARSQVDLVNEM
jgi:hypothetical protein